MKNIFKRNLFRRDRGAISNKADRYFNNDGVSRYVDPKTGKILASDGGVNNSIVQAVVNSIIRGVNEAELVVFKSEDDDRVVDHDHELNRLLRNPNKFYDGIELQRNLVYDYLIYGSAFIRVFTGQGDLAKAPVQLHWLDASKVSIKVDNRNNQTTGLTTENVYIEYKNGRVKERIPYEEVIRLRWRVDSDLLSGQSLLEPVKDEVATDDIARLRTFESLKNPRQTILATLKDTNYRPTQPELEQLISDYNELGSDALSIICLLDTSPSQRD